MRLINCGSLQLEEFFTEIPPYAILSHTWGLGELTLQDWTSPLDNDVRKKPGYAKIEGACKKATAEGINYVWVDTCCIDKTSSSELSEAINSMFAWYRDSRVCYAFLADVGKGDDEAFRKSRWFKRGWTLQELIAPANLVFYSKNWHALGTKTDEKKGALVSSITGIDSDYLRRPKNIYHASIARRMSWMANRTTTRVEDMAYCMLGIFDINMALLYGEGSRAFLRLQEEIIRVSDDQTIFCWQGVSGMHRASHDWISILAPHPAAFHQSSQFFPGPGKGIPATRPYTITNRGLRLTAPLLHTALGAYVILNVGLRTGRRDELSRVLIRLHRVPGEEDKKYVRFRAIPELMVTQVAPTLLLQTHEEIYIDSRNTKSGAIDGLLVSRMGSLQASLASTDVLSLSFNQVITLEEIDAQGIEFYHFDSTLEMRPDVERGGIVLRCSIGMAETFVLFVWAQRSVGRRPSWGLEVMPESSSISVDTCLAGVKTGDVGSWCGGRPLKSVLSWLYSYLRSSSLMCFLDLEEIPLVQGGQLGEEDVRFQYIKFFKDT